MICESVLMSERLSWFPYYFIILEGDVKVNIQIELDLDPLMTQDVNWLVRIKNA